MRWSSLIGAIVFCLFGFPVAVQAACSPYPYSLTNGTTADATQVMANFTTVSSCAGSAAPIASPSFTGTVDISGNLAVTGNTSIAASSGIGMELDTSGNSVMEVKATSTGGAYLMLDRYGTGASNTAVNFYTNGTTDFQMGVGVGVTGIFAIYDATTHGFPFTIVQSNNYVGINTYSPSYQLHVDGTAYATGAAGALSDQRHKRDIEPLSADAVSLIGQLKPVSFYWKDPKDDGMRGRQLGFIAQDVQKVLPDTVLTMADKEKTLGLKYNEFIPLLTKAIQQQHAEIVALKAENRKRQQEAAALRTREEAEITRLQVQFVSLQRRLDIQSAQR